MSLDDDVQKAFERLFTARRELAVHAERVRRLELQLEAARADMKLAEETVKGCETDMQCLVERAAGVEPTVSDRDRGCPDANLMAGYRPITTRWPR